MKNMNLKMWNKLIDSAEGVEVNLKIGKECELNVKGNFMAMAKIFGVAMEAQSIKSKEDDEYSFRELRDELDEILLDVKK